MLEKLHCSECGQGDFGWDFKRAIMWCDFCKAVTMWIKEAKKAPRRQKSLFSSDRRQKVFTFARG